ncbi:hypothetical protein ACFYYR_06320 [Streptomyces sp. NPDC001922]|uniref:hypothetical protein n=1 Tax=Streptomyces sp. NPDC001922 TaxID=3364624 RepID=UPI0036A5A2E4
MTDPEKWSWPVLSPLHSGSARPPAIPAVSRSDGAVTPRGFFSACEVTVRRYFRCAMRPEVRLTRRSETLTGKRRFWRGPTEKG